MMMGVGIDGSWLLLLSQWQLCLAWPCIDRRSCSAAGNISRRRSGSRQPVVKIVLT